MSLALHLTNVAGDNLLEVYAVDDHVNVLLVYHKTSVLLAAANIVIVRWNKKYSPRTLPNCNLSYLNVNINIDVLERAARPIS